MQDLDRGLIVGETSFGKGLVQRQYPLRDGSAIRVTVARYYTPSGRLIQRPYDGAIDDYYDTFSAENRDSLLAVKDSVEKRPKFSTIGGRTVYGGGGITPDYSVKYDQALNNETYKLLRHPSRVIFEYASDFVNKNRDLPIVKIFIKILRSAIKISRHLRKWRSKNCDLNIKQVEKDAEYLKILIKAEIAHGYWATMNTIRLCGFRIIKSRLPLILNEARKMLQIQ